MAEQDAILPDYNPDGGTSAGTGAGTDDPLGGNFVVETGAGLSNATSYVSVEAADLYHQIQGNPTEWELATADEKQDALRQGTEYLDLTFGTQWFSSRANETQALDWPRTWVYDIDGYLIGDDVVPGAVANATAYMGLKVLTERAEGRVILPDRDNSTNISEESIQVGPVKQSKKYTGPQGQTQTFRKAMFMLQSAGLIAPGARAGLA